MAKLLFLPLLALAALLSGCGPSITNLTSNPVPQNPSGIYEISMTVDNMDNAVIKDSMKPYVIIDGQARPMLESDIGRGIYKYNYTMPEGRNQARYYYTLDYQTEFKGALKDKKAGGENIYDLVLTNRYIITLESYRGPVGSNIPMVGRGFSKFDKVIVGGFEADTTYFSPTSINFVVPPLPAGDSYQVELASGNALLPVGSFQVDPAKLIVSPTSIDLGPGDRYNVVFGIDFNAPTGGLMIDVTTDIPESIIMPEVIIPKGARSVNTILEGGQPGTGTIFVSAPGFTEVKVPVRVFGFVEETATTEVDIITPASDTIIIDEQQDIILVD